MSNNSTLSVNSENHVILSCVELTASAPRSGVVWTKDGVEMSENVRVIYLTAINLHVWHSFNS